MNKYLLALSKYVELLRITIDRHLKFDKHVNKICSKATKNFMFSPGCKVSLLQKKNNNNF